MSSSAYGRAIGAQVFQRAGKYAVGRLNHLPIKVAIVLALGFSRLLNEAVVAKEKRQVFAFVL